MDKTKKQLIALILLVFFGANYSIHEYAIIPKLNELKSVQQEYEQQVSRLKYLKGQAKQVEETKAELERIRLQIAELDKIAPYSIDTPQLVYDFYNASKEFGLVGETISFELSGTEGAANTNNQNPSAQQKNGGNTGSNSQNTNQNQKSNNNSENQSKAQGSSQDTQDANKENVVYLRLSINLKVKGPKENVEDLIKNISKITERKLNVKSISLSMPEEEASEQKEENTYNEYQEDEEFIFDIGGNNSYTEDKFDFIDSNTLLADISFYHYVQMSGAEYERVKNYEFFNNDIGFDSLAEMFE